MAVECARMLKCLLLVIICVYAANGAKVVRYCFEKPPYDDRCQFPMIINSRQFLTNSSDCCLLPKAKYYADTTVLTAQIIFLGVKNCLPCKKLTGKVPTDPCANKVCPNGKVCKVRNHGRAKCVCKGCHSSQQRLIMRVCGTNGRDYKNECFLKRAACREGRTDIAVAYNGTCQIGCNNVVCREKNHSCMVDQYMRAYCVDCKKLPCSKRSKEDGPLCGADGEQYDSSCHLRLQTCRQGRTIGVAYNGSCIENATCDNINCGKKRCVQDSAGRPRCVTCSCDDYTDSKPTILCGTDNKTYPDYCSLRKEVCSSKMFIDVKHTGPCTGTNLLQKDSCSQQNNEQSSPTKEPRDDFDLYYITIEEFASLLRKDFGLKVELPAKKLKFRERIIVMRRLIRSLKKIWHKVKEE